MPHTKEFNPIYSEMLFRIADDTMSTPHLADTMGLPADTFKDHLAALEDLHLIIREDTEVRINWERIKKSYADWMDHVVDERIFFAEQVRDQGMREFYEPLTLWNQELRRAIIASDNLTRLFQNGFRNFRFLIENYSTKHLSVNQFFNEFTISFSDYKKFTRIIGDDEDLRTLSVICDRAMVNPFGFFAFHTEYQPAKT